MRKLLSDHFIFSMNSTEYYILTVILGIFVLTYTVHKILLHWKLPPGPVPIPLLGNIFSVRIRPFKTIAEWTKLYGDIITVYNGPKQVVWINDVNIGVEAFVKRAHIFSMRKAYPFICYFIGKKGTVVFENGSEWKSGRKWMLSVLRTFGLGKKSLEERITIEANSLCEAISDENGRSFDPNHFITCTVANILCAISFNKRYTYTDTEFIQLIKNVQAFMKSINIGNVEFHFPCLTNLPFFKHKRKQPEALLRFIQKHIDEHELTFDRNNIRDIVDSLIFETEKNEENSPFNKSTMHATIATMFVAGSETTASTIMWFIYFMVLNPDEQEKVYNEINAKFGSDGKPTVAELSKLPYLVATMCEVQRLGCTAPSLLPHGTSEECDLGGYRLPKGINVNLNVYKLHMDPGYWENPTKFSPSRFIDGDGVNVLRPKSFVPFGLGKRICVGENLAKTEMLIIMSRLIQRYRFMVPNDQPKPASEPNVGFTRSPKPFMITALPRI